MSHIGTLCVTFERGNRTPSASHQEHVRVPTSPYPCHCALCSGLLLLLAKFGEYESVASCALIMTNDVSHMCLLAILIFSLFKKSAYSNIWPNFQLCCHIVVEL